MLKNIIQQASKQPIQLFLIDGIGAVITGLLTGLVLTYFESFFGMPKLVLIPLALVAFIFAIYSFTCYFTIKKHWRFYLKIIAIANFLYCCVTFGFGIIYFNQLTIFGVLYFIGEIIIVLTLVTIELKVINFDKK